MRLTWCGVVAVAGALVGCAAPRNVQCVENGNCDRFQGGMCQAAPSGNQWCSYPDLACPSGYRYSDLDVGDGLSGECVAADSWPVIDASVDGPRPIPASWGKHIPGPGFESVGAVALAPDDGILIAGSFDQIIDIGGGPLTAAGTSDMFVAKFTAEGQHVWSKRFGNSASQAGGTELRVLSNGDLTIAGNYRGSLTIGTSTITAIGNQDVFVARLSGLGDPVWVRSGGTVGYDELDDLAVDSNDNIVVCGGFTGSGTFFGSSILTGSNDAWLVRLTNAGTHSWSRAMRSDGINNQCGVGTMINGDVVFAGNFTGSVNAGGSTFTSTNASLDIYVVRYSAANGTHVWSAAKGGAGNDYALDVESSGTSLVVSGGFSGSLSFGGSTLFSTGGDDTFVAKLDGANGNHQFSTRLGGPSSESAQHLAIRSDGQVTATGLFAGTVNFGGSSLTSNGDFDPFVVDLDGSSGVVLEVKSVGGAGRDEALDVASSTELLVFGGSFSATITVLGQPYTSTGMGDGYVLRIKR